MKEYVLLFRLDILTQEAQPTEAQIKAYMQQWTQWIDSISEKKGQLVAGGNHLQYSGKVIRGGGATSELPYAANQESVAGYIVIKAKNMNDAVSIAQRCPILAGGDKNSVEIRKTASPGT
jgi:hypothetical protein